MNERNAPDKRTRSKVWLSPSIVCADLLNLGRDVEALARCGVELFHVDVMDGRFVRNLGLSYDLVRALKSAVPVPLDVHLAVENPDIHVPLACESGADIVAFHPETAADASALVEEIHARGRRACLAVAPSYPLEALVPLLRLDAAPGPEAGRPDFVNLLMVEPGFSGQRMVPSARGKLGRLKRMLGAPGTSGAGRAAVRVMVDGNVSLENIPWMVEEGADVLVLGTSGLFGKGADLEEGVARVRSLVEEALGGLGAAGG